MTKRCPGCDTTKDVAEFYRNKSTKDGFGTYCKPCGRAKQNSSYASSNDEQKARKVERNRLWREANRDKVRESDKRYRDANPDKRKRHATNHYLKTTYGLTLNQYNELLAKQNGCCSICGTSDPGKHNFHVDHDHSCCPGTKTCGKCVRSLLCGMCNKGLGHFKDDPTLLRYAAEYLERHKTLNQ